MISAQTQQHNLVFLKLGTMRSFYWRDPIGILAGWVNEAGSIDKLY